MGQCPRHVDIYPCAMRFLPSKGRHLAGGLARRLEVLPFAISNVVAKRLMEFVLARHPTLFDRMGDSAGARILLDAVELPFVFLLVPNQAQPVLRIYRRSEPVEEDSRVRGTLLRLFSLVEGEVDGDALFFTRDLSITGDTEAVVCLRNCLDDLDRPITEDIANFFRTPGRRALEHMQEAERFVARKA